MAKSFESVDSVSQVPASAEKSAEQPNSAPGTDAGQALELLPVLQQMADAVAHGCRLAVASCTAAVAVLSPIRWDLDRAGKLLELAGFQLDSLGNDLDTLTSEFPRGGVAGPDDCLQPAHLTDLADLVADECERVRVAWLGARAVLAPDLAPNLDRLATVYDLAQGMADAVNNLADLVRVIVAPHGVTPQDPARAAFLARMAPLCDLEAPNHAARQAMAAQVASLGHASAEQGAGA